MANSSIPPPRGVCPDEKPFFYDHPLHLEGDHEIHKWHALTHAPTKKKIVASLGLELTDLHELGVLGDMLDLFHGSGFGEVSLMSYPLFNSLMVEFFVTFKKLTLPGSSHPEGWSFRIQGETYMRSRVDICSIFNWNVGGVVPHYTKEERLAFWYTISGLRSFTSDYSAKCIWHPVWKCMHRLISVNFNSRVDEGSRVSLEDLDVMIAISRGVTIDYFTFFTNRFEEMNNPESKTKALGCASLITKLALIEGFIFDCPPDAHKTLDKERLVRMQMFDESTGGWIHDPAIPTKKPKRKGAGSSSNA